MSHALERIVAKHYSRPKLMDAIEAGLRELEIGASQLHPIDLAPVDEFHTAGRLATLKALNLFPVKDTMHVLDAGAGLGGTARMLAEERGCRVTGLDICGDYVDTARMLTERMNLAERCQFQHGSVLDMPFKDASFDAALSFHVAMNIADRPRFYAELARTMRSGAPLCIFDVMKGPTDGMLYPVPWAETDATSFLENRDVTIALLADAGFDIIAEDNIRDFAISYFRDARRNAAGSETPPPLGLHLLTGANSSMKFANYLECLESHQIEPIILVACRR
jgi:MPBQ/MSBQ methyltransferase